MLPKPRTVDWSDNEEIYPKFPNPTKLEVIVDCIVENDEALIDYNRFEYRLNTLAECKQYVQTY